MNHLSDDDCKEAIIDLDGVEKLTPWEREFVETNLERTHFTDLQKKIIEQLLEKYDA